MGKVIGKVPSVIGGVSEQEPHDRRPGQMGQQVNLLPDAVRGLVRRRGTTMRHCASYTGTMSEAEAQRMREYSFLIDGNEYSLLYRAEASTSGTNGFMFLYDKVARHYIPIEYEASAFITELAAGGASALACIGRYVYIAGNTTVPTIEVEQVWDVAGTREKLAAWIRTGAYRRTYTVTLVRADGTTVSSSYTTFGAAYSELLDTSDIPLYLPGTTDPDPEYTKHVNDRINEYQGRVNEWTRLAADDIQPANIATKLADALSADHGVAATTVRGTVCVDDTDYVDIRIDDGADGQTVVAIGKTTPEPTRVTKAHWAGKIVQVRPDGANAQAVYYLRAEPETPGDTGFCNVVWFECEGVTQQITSLFGQLIIEDGVAYVARDGAGLETMAPSSGEHPDYKAATVGDGRSAPRPNFIGKPITMMTVFQDRLLIGSDAIVNASRPGDYLNFYRKTILSIVDDDPIEMYAQGSEGDTLRYAVLYDRDLVVFGDKKQYAIPGRQTLSARSPNIAAIGAHEGGDAQPIASGNYVFYPKASTGRTSLHQLQTGTQTASPESFEVSQQLDSYLNGAPLALTCLTAPDSVFLRTRDNPRIIYAYRYMDAATRERIADAWFAFEYAEELGTIIGISSYKGTLLIFCMRGAFVVADELDMSPTAGDLPALDSSRPYNALSEWHDVAEGLCAALDSGHEQHLLGCQIENLADFLIDVPECEPNLHVGVVSPAYVVPTAAFLRDTDGMAILDGVLTYSSVQVRVVHTGGFVATRTRAGVTDTALVFTASNLGTSSSTLFRQPLYSGVVNVPLYGDSRITEYRITSTTWLPLRITGIGWTGQSFYRVRRV